MELADPQGLPVLSVRQLMVRPVSAAALSRSTAGDRGLLEMIWTPVPLEGGDIGDDAVVWELPPHAGAQAGGDVLAAVYRGVHEVLEVLQSWLASDATGLGVVVTRGAVGPVDDDVTDLAGAAVWGWCALPRLNIRAGWCWWIPMGRSLSRMRLVSAHARVSRSWWFVEAWYMRHGWPR